MTDTGTNGNGRISPMSTAAETIRKLLLAHAKGDEAAFRAAAWEAVERERRVNHHIVANDLEKLLSQTIVPPGSRTELLMPMPSVNGSVPKDRDRNANLIDFQEPRRELEALVLSPDIRETINRILLERRQGDLLLAHGVRPVSKILFCGPPGCGKTVVAETIAKALFLPLAVVRFDAVVSSYLGETAANLRRVFDFARSRPVVLLFDEFDAIGKHRSAADEHGELKRVVNSFLQMLDGFHADTLTIAATNHQGLLDPALWRRFDEIVFFPPPTADEIEDLFVRLFRQIGLANDVRLSVAAFKLKGCSFADVERIALDAIKQSLLKSEKAVSGSILTAAIDRQIARQAVNDTSGHRTNGESNAGPKRRSKKR